VHLEGRCQVTLAWQVPLPFGITTGPHHGDHLGPVL